MKASDIMVGASIAALAILIAYALFQGGIGPMPAPTDLRDLAKQYVILA